jgi:hemerythrin
VGVTLLDDDHKKLVGLVNELYDGIQAGAGKESVGKVLDRLIDYTKVHFAHEEQFFSQTAYPASAAHKKEHDALCQQVVAVQEKYRAGAGNTLSFEVLNFLKNWLVNHIQGSDKKYGPYLNAKGIQ